MLRETAKKETPFTANNVKWMRIIAILVCIMWLLMGGIFENLPFLLVVVVVCALEHIFLFGYELQKESDELI